MAIRRLDPKAVKKVISAMDDAVDHDGSNMVAYAQTLDQKHLKLKEGVKPTYFLIRNIDPISELKINEAHQRIVPPSVDPVTKKQVPARISFVNEGEMSLKYFEFCVKEVEEDGKVSPIKIEELPLTVLQEIGSYAMLHSKVGENLKKT